MDETTEAFLTENDFGAIIDDLSGEGINTLEDLQKMSSEDLVNKTSLKLLQAKKLVDIITNPAHPKSPWKVKKDKESSGQAPDQATSPGSSSRSMDAIDKRAKQVEHVIDFTGFALDVSVGVLRIGEALPVVGNVCRLCNDVLRDAKAVHKKIKDVQQMVQRVLDIAKFLASLPDVLKHLAEESQTVVDIKAKMDEITNVITKVQTAVKKFSSAGYFEAMMKATK